MGAVRHARVPSQARGDRGPGAEFRLAHPLEHGTGVGARGGTRHRNVWGIGRVARPGGGSLPRTTGEVVTVRGLVVTPHRPWVVRGRGPAVPAPVELTWSVAGCA